MTEEIWMDEGRLYIVTQKTQVDVPNFGEATEYRFEHEGKTLAIAICPPRNKGLPRGALLSVRDVTDEYNDGSPRLFACKISCI